MGYYDIPILYIPFKRLSIVEEVFNQIKAMKPSRLYIAQDGPRDEDEAKALEDVINFILNNVDWDVKLHIFKSNQNNGPNLFIYKAINWFFENEERGIIIEEDGFSTKTYFDFAKNLLEKHDKDKEVYAICGFSAFSKNDNAKCDYFYSNINFAPWVFATWKDRWTKFDFELQNIDSFDFIYNVYKNKIMANIMMSYANIIVKNIEEFKDKITWDLKFRFTIQHNNGHCLFPRQNLIKHLDFDSLHSTSFHQDTWLNNIEEYIEIGEYDFQKFIACKENDTINQRYFEFLEKDILFSIISPKACNKIENILKNSNEIYIYGAGFFSYIFYSAYKYLLKEKLIAFIDDNKNGYILDKKVISSKDLKDNTTMILVVSRSNYVNNILEKLKNTYRGKIIILKDILKEANQ
jgi:hypothetical protein